MASKLSMPTSAVASAPMPGAVQQQTAAPIGIIITDPGNFSTHGINSDVEKQRLDKKERERPGSSCGGGSICGFFNTAWVARMVVEFAATLSLYFLLSVARVLNPQTFFFYTSFNVGFVAFATVFISVILFNYATGVTMSGTGSLVVVLSNWVVRGIRAESSEEEHGNKHDLKPIQYWYDIGRLLAMWFVQILGGYAGVILAIVVFLQGEKNEFYSIAELMTPVFGPALWLSGSYHITSWQASCMIFVGAFIQHAAILYTYLVDKLYKKSIWAGLVRGGSMFLGFMLFYAYTGGAFDFFSWLIPASLAWNCPEAGVLKATHGTQGELFAYLLAPVAGALAAVLFVWLWVWISQATHLKSNLNVQRAEHRKEKEDKLRRIFHGANDKGYQAVPSNKEEPMVELEGENEPVEEAKRTAAIGAKLPNIVLGKGIATRY